MPAQSTSTAGSDTTAGPLAERAFPEAAAALRSRIPAMLQEWVGQVHEQVPAARVRDIAAVIDSMPDILDKMADALASGDPAEVARLLERSPAQGIHRFQLHYDVRDLATEDRLLRRVILDHVEDALGRRASRDEVRALNWATDLMSQQAMIAFVEHQNARLRDAAEAELKYLSFLSHDLNNNLNGVNLSLQVLGCDLRHAGGFADALESLDMAEQAIDRTVNGMRRLLDHERLRHAGKGPAFGPVDLHVVATRAVKQFAREAGDTRVTLTVDVRPGTVVESDAELVALVLQNLVGNGVKFCDGSTVRVGSDDRDGRRAVWVADDGPGMAPQTLSLIFDAFRRGDVRGQRGVGLGLAIASQAAKLLNAELTVESKLGHGSTFRLAFPPQPIIDLTASPQA